MYNFLLYFALFLIYSFLGWVIEVIFCSKIQKKFVDRGFLIGPYCPIYGTAALIIILLLKKYENDIAALFVMSIVVCSVIEYVTSYIMEKLFKTRWWDYSDKPFNINGRICLSNSFLFGFLGVLLVYFINPFTYSIITKIPNILFVIIFGSLFVLFCVDVGISFRIISKIKITVDDMKKDNTEEITRKVKKILSKHSRLQRRLINAFPNLELIKRKIENRKIKK